MGRVGIVSLCVVAVCGLYFARLPHSSNSSGGATPAAQDAHIQSPANAHVLAAYGGQSLAFEPNRGQTDGRVQYMAHGNGFSLFLTPDEAVLSMSGNHSKTRRKGMEKAAPQTDPASILMQLVGARKNASPVAEQQQAGVSNYFVGRDRQHWQSNVPHFSRVRYKEVYPGIDLAFHGAQQQLEFDLVVAPQACPDAVRLGFGGAKQVKLNDAGELVLQSAAGDVRLHKPIAYQEQDGRRRAVEAAFAVKGSQVGFILGDYDHSRELVIDPVLTYAEYLGGTSADTGFTIAVDGSGNAYIAGQTASNNFLPSPSGTYQTSYAGGPDDAFITKLDANGNTVFSTYLGGSKDDSINGIAIDGSGNIYVAGGTQSNLDFPITVGAAQGSFGGPSGGLDAFASKISADGTTLVYSTYIGGASDDVGNAVAVDGSGNVYVAGQTASHNFPVTAGVLQGSFSAQFDGFVTEVKADGSAFLYSTYLGGSGIDNATAIAVDSSGDAFIAGVTTSSDFPVTAGVFQTAFGAHGNDDAFVSKINPTGTVLTYSSYLGGSGTDDAYAIAIDSGGSVYLTGLTNSSDFPTHSPLQAALKGTQNAFVSKVAPDATSLTFSTYLGGSGMETGSGIALDSSSNVYVAGQTTSADFPQAASLTGNSTLKGSSDSFITEVKSDGSSLLFSSYFGGTGNEDVFPGTTEGLFPSGLAVDSAGNIYVSGNTDSSDFPVTNSSTYQGGVDAFVAKIAPGAPPAPDFSLDVSPTAATVTHGSTAGPFTATIVAVNGFASAVTITCSGLPAGASCGSAAIAAGSTSTTFSITTTAAAQIAPLTGQASPHGQRSPLLAIWLAVPALALVGAGVQRKASTRKMITAFLLGCLLFAGLTFMAACGGGGGGGGTHTPPGTYTITVRGTSGALGHNAAHTITLTVN
jgi:hypothetical protein